ncbi:hypothetical protein BJ912DRAFT_922362 [Pholiota molesta]|nr:hypothetical protein BJ912DRAFT_922362 [Pholiota molesta]
MVLTEAEKKESHRAACARYYQKKRRSLREKSKLHMRQLRASRKLGANPQERISKNSEVLMEVPSLVAQSPLSSKPPTVRPTKQQPRTLSNKRNTPRVSLKEHHSPSSESELPNSSCESDSDEQSESSSENNSERGQKGIPEATFDGLPLVEFRAQRAARMEEYGRLGSEDLNSWYAEICREEGRECFEDDNESLPVASDTEDH